MEEKQFKEISEKLDKVIKLLAVQSVGEKKQSEAIECLSAVGFQPMEIADLIVTCSPKTGPKIKSQLALEWARKGGIYATQGTYS